MKKKRTHRQRCTQNALVWLCYLGSFSHPSFASAGQDRFAETHDTNHATACAHAGLEQGLWHVSQAFFEHGNSSGNVVFSPYSWAQALAALQFASQGRTQQQIASVLRMPENPESVAHSWAVEQIQRASRASTWPKDTGFFPAMSVWAAPATEVSETLQRYLNVAFGERWHVRAEHISEDALRTHINHWACEKTRGHVPKVLPDDWSAPQMAIFLVNTLFFQAPWSRAFDVEKTTLKPFWNADASVVDVPTMQQVLWAGYTRHQGHFIVEIPYQKGQFSLTLVWSDAASVPQLSQSLWQRLQMPVPMERIALKMPQYRVQTHLQLKPWLQKMGLKDAFDAKDARFVHMSREGTPVYVDEVLHQAEFVVDEAGSKAAAAVVSGLKITSFQRDIPHVHVNRPFVFVLRDKKTGFVLFAGRIVHLGGSLEGIDASGAPQVPHRKNTREQF